MAVRERQRIGGVDLSSIAGLRPLADVRSLSGVRVYDVGQGDAIAVIDGAGIPVLQIDYGGRQGHPFAAMSSEDVDAYLPISHDRLLMMTHWDEDHWSSAPRGNAARAAHWLVPRQVTSPRAVRFSAELNHIQCIPEDEVGEVFCFAAENGDEIWWEKIASSEIDASRHEDCNRTGVALSLVRRNREGGEVILMPGDAAFGAVSHYRRFRNEGFSLTGLVAFHHGSGSHWTRVTERLVTQWPQNNGPCEIVFSCAAENSFGHPDAKRYATLFPNTKPECTADARKRCDSFIDIKFRT